MGPMVILHRTQSGSYCLAELNGTMSNLGLPLSALSRPLVLFNPSDVPC